ncbi:hypothetical protein ACFU44_00570 [Nocardia rhizosphaerihabitans]|uniref:hypothetical protein n=1 Tax=Nocardia rhizosphaerihabitans TaxID=1691570 RepID=UPI00366F021C
MGVYVDAAERQLAVAEAELMTAHRGKKVTGRIGWAAFSATVVAIPLMMNVSMAWASLLVASAVVALVMVIVTAMKDEDFSDCVRRASTALDKLEGARSYEARVR